MRDSSMIRKILLLCWWSLACVVLLKGQLTVRASCNFLHYSFVRPDNWIRSQCCFKITVIYRKCLKGTTLWSVVYSFVQCSVFAQRPIWHPHMSYLATTRRYSVCCHRYDPRAGINLNIVLFRKCKPFLYGPTWRSFRLKFLFPSCIDTVLIVCLD